MESHNKLIERRQSQSPYHDLQADKRTNGILYISLWGAWKHSVTYTSFEWPKCLLIKKATQRNEAMPIREQNETAGVYGLIAIQVQYIQGHTDSVWFMEVQSWWLIEGVNIYGTYLFTMKTVIPAMF